MMLCRLKGRLIGYPDKAFESKFVGCGNQYLCVIAWFSPFLRRVVPARNRVLFHITNSRKLPPSARFILQGVDFHSRFLDFAGMTISVWGSRFRGNDNSYLGCGGSRLRENDKS
jgi:hypothetical protein